MNDDLRIADHPILGAGESRTPVVIYFNGEAVPAYEGEPIAAALTAAGHRSFRTTRREQRPRGIFCAIGRCTDCMMIVDGIPNTRTCVTPVRDGMRVETQHGLA